MKSSIDENYITKWLVLGPFFPGDLNTDFLVDAGGEANIQPQEGDTITTMEGKTLTWKRYNTKGNIVDLVDAVGYHENSIAYAFCTLQSNIAGEAQIHLGSDDGIAVWINGTQVHRNPVNRPLLPDEDVLKTDLKSGANHCLVKVSQLDDSWCFAMRVVMLHPNRAVLSGIITDEANVPIPNADVRLEQDGREIAPAQTDDSGNYTLDIYPVQGPYDLSATCGNLGNWQFDIRLCEEEHQTLNLILKKAISIEGTILMHDNTTPHVAVPIQAVMKEEVVSTTLSDEGGKYKFINLKPGSYQVRCQTLNRSIYYGQEEPSEPESRKTGEQENRFTHNVGFDTASPTQPKSRFTSAGINNAQRGGTLQVEPDKTLVSIDFYFAPFKKGTWKNYSYFDGLTDNRIYAIHRASDGMMWFGTAGGISRYDGKEFVNFTTEDGDWVTVIHSEPDGVMWFGTWGGGVSRYDGEKFVTFNTKDGLAHNVVKSIHKDSDGVMWFGTFGGVSRYANPNRRLRLTDGNKFVTLTTSDGLAHNWVTAIHETSDGILWFGTEGGVSCYDGEEFTNFTTKDGLAHNEVTSIYSAPDGAMWFGTVDGVSRVVYPFDKLRAGSERSRRDRIEFTNFTTKDGLVHNVVIAIHGDSDGILWFGTSDGVSRYNGKEFTNFIAEDGLAHNWVYTIHSDPNGVLWFGTRGGVSRYINPNRRLRLTEKSNGRLPARSRQVRFTDEKGCFTFTTKDGLVSNEVTAIYRAPDGVMWIGTKDGVSQYANPNRRLRLTAKGNGRLRLTDGNKFITLTTQDGLAHNEVTAIYGTSDGIIWFGTRNGLSRYNGKEFVTFTTKDGLAHNEVIAIYGASDGIIWFGTTLGGVSRYDGNNFVNFTTKDGLAHNEVAAIHGTRDGIMWFGTRNGVSLYDGEKFVTLSTKDGLAHNWVYTIHSDPDGVLWFGTRSGTSRVVYPERSRRDEKEFVNFSTKDGLAHNIVSIIYCDSDGILSLGTRGGGVSHYDGIAWTSLDTRDGLTGNNVTSICQDSDGFLWFGTDGGITRYRRDIVPPRACITAVTTDRRYTDLNSIEPATTGMRITFEYSSIDFKTHPDKRLYRYQLEGYDSYWSKPTKETRVDYADLPVGEYRFRVQAIDRDLVYSESPATVHLTIQPHSVEEALKKSEEKFKSVLERMIDIYYYADLNGNLVTVSPSGIKLLGYDSIEEILGKNLAKDFYYYPEDREVFLRELKKHGKVTNYEVVLKRKDGRPIIVETNTHFVYDETGKPIGVDGIFRDVTERKKTEEALKRERDFTSAVIDTAGALVVVLDPEGRIIRFNQTCEQTTGYSFNEVRDRYVWDVFLIPEELKRVKAVFEELRIGNFPNDAENYWVTKDGRLRLITWSNTVLFDNDGSVEYIIGIGIDITERRRAVQALRESEDAKRIQAAKMESLRQLIAGVAHEMNNPVGVISSNNDISSRAIGKIREILVQDYPQEQRLKALDVLENMNQTSQIASERIAEIVSNLRSFVRLDEAEWQIADVHEGMDNAIALMEMEPEFKSRIKVTKDYGDIPKIYCSPSSLNQVFRSMLRNASEAIKESGEVQIRTFVREEHIKIEISDTGKGIPTENLDRIFDPGFTTKGVRVGVGLGLSICYQIIVDEHKGHIDVSSELEKGTTFTITLPQYSSGKEKTQ